MDDLDLGATIKGFSPGQKVFNRYSLVRLLGRGGMGVVWLAKDEELGRETALKFLPEVLAADRSAVDDMKREVRRAIDLAHPHIVKIHDFITDGRTAAVSMEYIAGGTLSSLRIDQPGRVFHADDLAKWTAQLCGALDYAHQEAEIVHRDLKPTNLMVDAKGRLRVLDFGIAASISESVTRVSKQAGSSGTPVYMSPQQMMGEDPAVTDDIYAVGATLFELLTGKPPFHAGNILLQVQNKVAPLVNERRQVAGHAPVPEGWEQAIAACLAKDPAERPQSGAELLQSLGGGPAPAPSTKPRKQAPAAVQRTATPLPLAAAPVIAAVPSNERPIPLPGADLPWARRWLLAPIAGALPASLTLGAMGYGFGQFSGPRSEIFLESLLAAQLFGTVLFLILIAIRRPWRFRGSKGVVILGALTGSLTGVWAALLGVSVEYALASGAIGAAIGGISGWVLYRVAAKATFLPYGPITWTNPPLVYASQIACVIITMIFFGKVLPVEEKRAEREAYVRDWTPKVDEAFRMVFDREPTAEERDKYLGQTKSSAWWSPAHLRREMRESPEGLQGGRLRVPEEFATIEDAITNANAGHVVLVGPGTYQARLVLKSGVSLIGAGRDKTFVTWNTENNVVYAASEVSKVRINGFTFRQNAGKDAKPGYPAVFLAGKDLEFADNAVVESFSHGIILSGALNCTIRNNTIRNAAWDGILVEKGATGWIEGNVIERNQQRGIVLYEQPGGLSVSNNTITDNPDCGLLILKGEGVLIADNTLTRNGSRSSGGGIFIDKGAGRPVLRGNKANNNTGVGIAWARDATPPVIEAGNFIDGKELGLPDGGGRPARPLTTAGTLNPADPTRIFTTGDVDTAPVTVTPMRPVYPPKMLRAGLTGSVEMEFVVWPDGTASSANVLSFTNSDFVTAALEALSKARFRPAMLKGVAVKCRIKQTVTFRLE